MDQYVVPVVMPSKDVLVTEFTLEIDEQNLILNLKFPAYFRSRVLALLDSGKAEFVLNEMEEPLSGQR